MNTPTPLHTPPEEIWRRPFVTAHQRWCHDFVLELRLRDVPGPVIGERLAEVERHCADTGETPAEAFGDATGYAAQIDQDSSPERVPGVWKISALSSGQVLALLVGTSAVPAWTRGEPLGYNAVQILCLGAVLLLSLLLPLLLRPLLRHPWTVGLPLTAAVLLGGGGAALSARADLPTVVQLPAPAVATGLFVVVVVLGWFLHRELAGDGEHDLVTSPLTATPGQPRPARLRGRWVTFLPACLVPVAYLVLTALSWLIP